MALLPTGLALMLVVGTNNEKIRRIENANHTQNIVFAAGKTRDEQRVAGIPNQR